LYKDKDINESWYKRSKYFLYNILLKVSQSFVRNDEHFFLSSYLPLFFDLKLQYKLGQVPKVWSRVLPQHTCIDLMSRQHEIIKTADSFVDIVRKMALVHIPVTYLEGYKELTKSTYNLPWPNNPKSIFTSVSFYADDVFKAWTAQKCENGSKLIIGQHGGTYGSAAWSFIEDHQIAIADKWLSWGQGNNQYSNVIAMFNLKLATTRVGCNPEGNALLVELSNSRYSSHMCAMPSSSQWISYFEDQECFVRRLPEKIQEHLQIRCAHNHGWDEAERWKEKFPKVTVTSSYDQNFIKALKQSRICISTYNATTFLETLSWNFPTIVFWDPKFSDINESSKPYFDLLESVGIFHRTPESAAKQLTDIWSDVLEWWNSTDVQKSREEFCDYFSRTSESPLEDLARVLS
jgi:putative transferase (TIGR04331 family)